MTKAKRGVWWFGIAAVAVAAMAAHGWNVWLCVGIVALALAKS